MKSIKQRAGVLALAMLVALGACGKKSSLFLEPGKKGAPAAADTAHRGPTVRGISERRPPARPQGDVRERVSDNQNPRPLAIGGSGVWGAAPRLESAYVSRDRSIPTNAQARPLAPGTPVTMP
jgi:predicted small lipoprotein YifL